MARICYWYKLSPRQYDELEFREISAMAECVQQIHNNGGSDSSLEELEEEIG